MGSPFLGYRMGGSPRLATVRRAPRKTPPGACPIEGLLGRHAWGLCTMTRRERGRAPWPGRAEARRGRFGPCPMGCAASTTAAACRRATGRTCRRPERPRPAPAWQVRTQGRLPHLKYSQCRGRDRHRIAVSHQTPIVTSTPRPNPHRRRSPAATPSGHQPAPASGSSATPPPSPLTPGNLPPSSRPCTTPPRLSPASAAKISKPSAKPPPTGACISRPGWCRPQPMLPTTTFLPRHRARNGSCTPTPPRFAPPARPRPPSTISLPPCKLRADSSATSGCLAGRPLWGSRHHPSWA
jgi:hypothetical protein